MMMTLRKVSCLLLWAALAIFMACGEKQTTDDPNLADARQTVQQGYEHLLAGNYEAFLAAKAYADSLPNDYREQMLTNYKQFISNQQKVHGGITSMSVNRAMYAKPNVGISPTDTLNKEMIEEAKKDGKDPKTASQTPFDFIANGDTALVRRVRNEREK